MTGRVKINSGNLPAEKTSVWASSNRVSPVSTFSTSSPGERSPRHRTGGVTPAGAITFAPASVSAESVALSGLSRKMKVTVSAPRERALARASPANASPPNNHRIPTARYRLMSLFAGTQQVQQQASAGQRRFQRFLGTPGQSAVPPARGEKHRLVAVIQKAGHGHVTTQHLAGFGLHTHLQDTVDIPFENRFGQPVLGNGGIEQPPRRSVPSYTVAPWPNLAAKKAVERPWTPPPTTAMRRPVSGALNGWMRSLWVRS
jgi:hypothetical protein